MKRVLLRLGALCLTLTLLCTCAAAETATSLDYTVEEKLVKQLQAGSGFAGTLTLEATAVAGKESEALTTIQPLTFDISYIYVRADTAQKTDAESRMTLALVDGEKTMGTAEFSLQSGALTLASTLLGDGWYTLGRSAAGADETVAGMGETVAGAVQDRLEQTALPGLAAFALGVLSRVDGPETVDLTDLTEPYLTKIDLWIEGYRQNALLGKADDGTTTMEVDYDVPAPAVKAQLKQMVMDLLADDALLTALSGLLPEEEAQSYLNPSLLSYYFYAIDELPLTGNLTVSRTVNLKGETLALSLFLPLYDSVNGAATLRYDRRQGGGDLPDENTMELTEDNLLLRVNYQTYSTLTGTTVYQGTVLRQPLGTEAFEVDAEGTPTENSRKTLSAAFTISAAKEVSTDGQGKSSLTRNVRLTVTPEYTPDDIEDDAVAPTEAQQAEYVTFTPMEIALDSIFSSGQAKNAATAVDLMVTVSGENLPQTYKLTLSGKTKGKWTPDAIDPQTATSLAGMDETALQALLAQAAVKGGLMLLPYVSLPTVTPSASPAPEATMSDTASPVPETTEAATAETASSTPETAETPAEETISPAPEITEAATVDTVSPMSETTGAPVETPSVTAAP